MTVLERRLPAWISYRHVLADPDPALRHTSRGSLLCRYTPADPYTIAMHTEHAMSGESWLCGREVLTTGLCGPFRTDPAGRAAAPLVRVAMLPANVVRIEVDQPTVRVWTPADAVLEFLHQTRQLVPLGKEHHHIDWDHVLHALLTGGERDA